VGEQSIRAATDTDVAAVTTLVRAAYAKYVERLGRPPAPMIADYGALVAAGGGWVVERDGRVVGVMILNAATDHLLVGNVAVLPVYQGHGLGTLLLAHAEAQARQRGFKEMRLFTNERMHENIAIYQRLGWVEYDRGEQDGFRRVFMKKILPEARSS
jgi:N-acetylglutamate synthase-like GNAT family acetyltransferase